MKRIKSVAIIGAGAIGSYYGARLQQAGCSVQFFTRSGHVALSQSPMKISSVEGDFQIEAKSFAETSLMNKADLVILATKVLDSIDYIALLKPVVGKDSIILTIQNGINKEEELAVTFPNNVLIGGLAFTCLTRITPNEIEHSAYGRVDIGYLRATDNEVVDKVVELFNGSQIESANGGLLRPIRWKKLVWNVSYNTLSVVAGGVKTDAMVECCSLSSLVADLMAEVLTIAVADGFPLPEELPQQMYKTTKKMTPYKTSMLLDYENGRAMEMEAILGEPLRIADKLGVAVPTMKTIYRLLKALERKIKG